MSCCAHRSGATARVLIFLVLMIPQAARKIVRGTAAATLVLLASAFLAPKSAQASCGDYVMIGGHHAAHRSGAAPAGHADTGGQTGEKSPVPRCHGPMCSNDSLPPAAPAPRTEMTVERWAVSLGTGLPILPECEALLAEARVFPCDGFGLSVLRPPR
jgi:hypothetical protein